MKIVLPAAILASVIALGFAAPASAAMQQYQTVCTTIQNSSEPPSGTYVAPDGTKWAGNRQNGNVPESLVSGGSSSTSCTEVPVDPA